MVMKIAIQGIAGSFHEQAALEYFKDTELEFIECRNFHAVFEAVKNGKADHGVVAVENSLHGSISPVYRLLAQENLWVHGEVRLHISMCLIGKKQMELVELNQPQTTVLSHFAAFGQCERWLETNIPLAQQVEDEDTAAAVEKVMANNDEHMLAIASEHAAEMYDGVILQKNLNDDPDNYTRFFMIAKDAPKDTIANRTSIILQENSSDKAGTLYMALGTFAKLEINLSKLDSHPRPGKVRNYAFYIDFDEDLYSKKGQTAISELEAQGWKIKILGTYHAAN